MVVFSSLPCDQFLGLICWADRSLMAVGLGTRFSRIFQSLAKVIGNKGFQNLMVLNLKETGDKWRSTRGGKPFVYTPTATASVLASRQPCARADHSASFPSGDPKTLKVLLSHELTPGYHCHWRTGQDAYALRIKLRREDLGGWSSSSSQGSDVEQLQSSHEEADTRIILHAKAAYRDGYERVIGLVQGGHVVW
ncbi:hypothetical protein GWK47_018587 [Chionoecetes opilio]|uniref:Uncharacterized protein n=1 Tax=Chionoecetes opilio TaxID=41210 RepID=A0A8J5CGE2_CHIOP|nr:hypothetical protein GWK47_018587 [Chionoecetes opilio]